MKSVYHAKGECLHNEEYLRLVSETLQEKINSVIDLHPLFVKTFLSMMLVTKNDKVHKNKVEQLYKDIDFNKLQNITNLDQFVVYIVEYMKNRLFDQKKFFKLLQVLLLV